LKKTYLLETFIPYVFAKVKSPYFSPQERGNLMELIITLRFRQRWWEEPEARALLPDWVNELQIEKPRGVLDCRWEDFLNVDAFIAQLDDEHFPWIVLPSTKAGPDIRYSVFSCYIKTKWTTNSNSSMYVRVEDCEKNMSTMDKKNWYKSDGTKYPIVKEKVKDKEFLHMRFELPYTAPSLRNDFKDTKNVICMDLNSKLAKPFFGDYFIERYKSFVEESLRARKEASSSSSQ
jgi:hypothetical protein